MLDVLGSDLKVCDVLSVWWAPRGATVTALEPYTGPLAHLFPEGAQIATFGAIRMTINNDARYRRA